MRARLARDAHSPAPVRAVVVVAFGLCSALAFGACADAPITPDQLEADGQLKPARSGGGQSAFGARPAMPRTASVVQVEAVLAATPNGALDDASTFPPDVGTVHLHVRADGLGRERDVSFRWTHGEHSLVIPGELVPSGQFVLAASIDVQPDQTGTWRVDVVAEPMRAGEVPEVLLSREFLILSERPSE